MIKVKKSLTMFGEYPQANEIKVKWTLLHTLIIVAVSSFVIGISIYEYCCYKYSSFSKLITIFGLYIDIIGVVIASLKTPFYGIFYDGGKIEVTRQQYEKKYFQRGMFLIALGMIVQVIGTFLK